jgi:ABC-type Mn/Zn transport systems, ATPase component
MLLACNNVTLGYDNKKVIEDFSLEIHAGDYWCIVGENGAGKSTLIKGMLGLLKPMKGKIQYVEGFTKQNIGYLPQQSEAQKNFPASVMEVVLSGCLNRKKWSVFYNKADKQIALDNMEKLGVAQLKNECYRDLSGGQQQRVLLARALCATNEILILDEPVTGLDPAGVTELYQGLRELNASHGITIIMVSHDVKQVLNEAKQVLHIGEQIFAGDVEEYKKMKGASL